VARLRVGINGFGRIGRVLFREGFEDLDIVGINDLGNTDQMAHLLKFDSSHGIYRHEVMHDEHHLIVSGKKIPLSKEKDPTKIPWKSWEVDLVLECTGVFKSKEDYQKHMAGGAKKVLVSAPSKGVDLTVVLGVNHQLYNSAQHHVISNASCTTNCLAPVVKVLHEQFGIEYGMMTTVHSYTNDQRLLDAPHSDLRRARSAAMSMIPTTTGAAKTVGEILPELKGRIDGTSIRVPTPNVSLCDFVFTAAKDVSVEKINTALTTAANSTLKGILGVEERPLVSHDFNGNKLSSIVDLPCTMTLGPRMGKVMSWYDNETGFSNRMIEMAQFIFKKGL
jgi:glyceraldehyde 3-phosphate dehydrogenase